MKIRDSLNNLIKKGYLLHGSRFKFSEAKPNKRDGLKEGGKLKAVYATDIADLAMFKAILDPAKVGLASEKRISVHNWRFTKNDDIEFWVSKNYVDKNAFSRGYVYAFKGKIFKKLHKLPHEFYSKDELAPDKIFEVDPADFFEFNQIIIWPKESLVRSGKFKEEELGLMGY